VKLALLAFVVAAAALATACNINENCIGCENGDDAGDDGGDDAGTIDASDGSVLMDGCVPVGAEVCNGLDDDCNGTPDDNPAQVGDDCGVDEGQCTVGVYECNSGALECTGVPASAEECDNIDNDCDGDVDDGNPEGGANCGSNVGECIGGTTTCIDGGILDCVGDSGVPGQNPEVCDGKDNDCDTFFDEDVATAGDCGPPEFGECEPGVLTCVGGGYICVGGQGPTFEECDDLNQDCDPLEDPANGWDLLGDVHNCGSCGHNCVGTIANATERCLDGACAVASCDPGFFDDPRPSHPGLDCDYACDYQGTQEACNLTDDDCDFVVDEDLTPPPICDQDGECSGTVASCEAGGYDCVYGDTVSTDANGDIEPEQLCDGLDNDCDGVADDSFTTLGDECDGTGVGVCQKHGHLQCDPNDATGAPICIIDDNGLPSSSEICDDLDNDCDGNTDENLLTLENWVSIGGGRSIMQYEVSRPDATATSAGVKTTYPCSRPGAQPWTMVKQPEAELACAVIGARLCTEQEWHRACAAVTGTTWPFSEPTTANADMFFEAEDYTTLTQRTPTVAHGYDGVERSWVPDYTIAAGTPTVSYSGISALRASPNTTANISVSSANAPSDSPRLDYQITFVGAGTVNRYVWVRMFAPTNSDNELRIGISATPGTTAPTQSITASSNNAWVWVRAAAIGVTAGTKFVSLYMREDGLKVDAIFVTKNSGTTAPTNTTTNGGDWSFSTSPDVFADSTCNGKENDTDAATASINEDAILPGGSKAQCFANIGTGAFDMSGNVKEWTKERVTDQNPIRGGASNNLQGGTTCSNAFSLANDNFFFNNVGFRCCK
jgi:hypothetical protein